jgi:hypothetical protein
MTMRSITRHKTRCIQHSLMDGQLPLSFSLFLSVFPPFFHLTFPSLPSNYSHKRQTLTDISLSAMFHTGATLLCFPIICLIRTKNDLQILQPHSTQLHCKPLAARFNSLIKQAQAHLECPGMEFPAATFTLLVL